MKIAELKGFVAAARANALRGSIEDYGRRGVHRSRGTWLATANAGGQCSPLPEAECHEWRGTLREIDETIADVLARYPDVTSVYIAGGYDWAPSPHAFSVDDYEPWTGAWSVTVWQRGS